MPCTITAGRSMPSGPPMYTPHSFSNAPKNLTIFCVSTPLPSFLLTAPPPPLSVCIAPNSTNLPRLSESLNAMGRLIVRVLAAPVRSSRSTTRQTSCQVCWCSMYSCSNSMLSPSRSLGLIRPLELALDVILSSSDLSNFSAPRYQNTVLAARAEKGESASSSPAESSLDLLIVPFELTLADAAPPVEADEASEVGIDPSVRSYSSDSNSARSFLYIPDSGSPR
mmetsp:Transcript_58096/g.123212  ORF Transcript_58096/g.123212 Transcript_58096/m.123212 type:complete len:224 (+) Transcript_58096:316-987(+)